MNRRHDDALPSRRLRGWLAANQEPVAWGVLAMLSALLTTIAWRLLIA